MNDHKILEYSVVVPFYNEQGNVTPLYSDLKKVFEEISGEYEIIFVNDGSIDNTLQEMKELKPLKIINFRKNFGQTAALDAGFKEAKGKYIITLDGDGQNPPSEIPILISKMEEGGLDVVCGWRYKRKDTTLKRVFSRGAYFLRGFLVKDHVHDAGCTLRLYKKECFDDFDLFGEMHRFIPAALYWRGFRVGEIKVSHKPRVHGLSKYNWTRALKGFIDMISIWFWRKFSNRPLHLFGGAGIFFVLIGVLFFIVLGLLRLFLGYSLSDKIWPLVATLLIVVGVQLFVSGIMTDILIKGYYSNGKTSYNIKDIIVN
ncbi:glycosyltransferase [Patescibacteria group bacterium]|nr:glycosyltransferase [Patescibacteria group bacterium]